MALADAAVKSACALDPRAAVEAIPRSYNFAADILERNLAEWDEPTLGVVVDGALWYVANSHWPSFPGDDSAPTDVTKLSPTSVRRLALD